MGRKRANKKTNNVTLRGSCLAAVSTATNGLVNNLFLNPNNLSSTRLDSISTIFSLFRFKKLIIQLAGMTIDSTFDMGTGLANHSLVVAYSTNLDVNPPTTADEAAELDLVGPLTQFTNFAGAVSGVALTQEARWTTPVYFRISSKELLKNREFPWYQVNGPTSPGSNANAQIANQGFISFAFDQAFGTNGVGSLQFILWYECEFSDAGGGAGAPRPFRPLLRALRDDEENEETRREGIPDLRVTPPTLNKSGGKDVSLSGLSTSALLREIASRSTRAPKTKGDADD